MKIVITQAVWGKKYLKLFTKYSIPTLLAENNIPFSSNEHEITFLIYSTRSEIKYLKKLDIILSLLRYVKIEWVELESFGFSRWLIPGEQGNDKYTFLTNLHDHSVRFSKKYDVLMFNYADFLWGDGSIKNIINFYMDDKVDAVLGFCLPVDQSNFIDKLDQLIGSSKDLFLKISNYDFTELILSNLHREAQLRFWDGPVFTLVPTYIMWSVGYKGAILRAYHQTIFAMKTNLTYLDDGFLNKGSLDGYVSSLICENDNYRIANDSNKVSVCSLYETTLDSRAPPWVDRDHAITTCLRSSVSLSQRKLALEPIYLGNKSEILDSDWINVTNNSAEYLEMAHEKIGFNEFTYIKSNKLAVLKQTMKGVANSSLEASANYFLSIIVTKLKYFSENKSKTIKLFLVIFPLKSVESFFAKITNSDQVDSKFFINIIFKNFSIDKLQMNIYKYLFEVYKYLYKIKEIGSSINFRENLISNADFSKKLYESFEHKDGVLNQLQFEDWFGHFDCSSKSFIKENFIYGNSKVQSLLRITYEGNAKNLFLANQIFANKYNRSLSGKFQFSFVISNNSQYETHAALLIHMPKTENFQTYYDTSAIFEVSENSVVTSSSFLVLPNTNNRICRGYFYIHPSHINLIKSYGFKACISITNQGAGNRLVVLSDFIVSIVDTKTEKASLLDQTIIINGLPNYLKELFTYNIRLNLLEKIKFYVSDLIKLVLLSFFNHTNTKPNNYLIDNALSDILDFIIKYELDNNKNHFLYEKILERILYLKKLSRFDCRLNFLEMFLRSKIGDISGCLACNEAGQFNAIYNVFDDIDSIDISIGFSNQNSILIFIDAIAKYKILKNDHRIYNIYIDNNFGYLTNIYLKSYSTILNIHFENKDFNQIKNRITKENWSIVIPSLINRKYITSSQMVKEVNEIWKDKFLNRNVYIQPTYLELISKTTQFITLSNKKINRITVIISNNLFSKTTCRSDNFLSLDLYIELLLHLKLRYGFVCIVASKDTAALFHEKLLFTKAGLEIIDLSEDIDKLRLIYNRIENSKILLTNDVSFDFIARNLNIPSLLFNCDIDSVNYSIKNHLLVEGKNTKFNILNTLPLSNAQRLIDLNQEHNFYKNDHTNKFEILNLISILNI